MKGQVRVGAAHDLSQAVLLPILARFARTYPEIELELRTMQGYPNTTTEGLDVAFLVAHQKALPDSTQRSRKIGAFNRMLFASEHYLKQNGTPRQLSDLRDHTCLRFALGGLQKQWDLRRGRERTSIEVRGRCSTNSVGLLAQWAREDLGVTVLPQFLAREGDAGKALTRVLPDWEAVPGIVFAVTPAQIVPAKTRELIEFVKLEISAQLGSE